MPEQNYSLLYALSLPHRYRCYVNRLHAAADRHRVRDREGDNKDLRAIGEQ